MELKALSFVTFD